MSKKPILSAAELEIRAGVMLMHAEARRRVEEKLARKEIPQAAPRDPISECQKLADRDARYARILARQAARAATEADRRARLAARLQKEAQQNAGRTKPDWRGSYTPAQFEKMFGYDK